jgi:cytochrome P450/NADPH-cytochrome P450 reductase
MGLLVAEVLIESGKRANRSTLQNQLYHRSEQERQENVRKMHQLADELIAERRRNPQPDAKDLMNIMMNAVDRETGEKLSDENIRFNLCTFLVSQRELFKGPSTNVKGCGP